MQSDAALVSYEARMRRHEHIMCCCACSHVVESMSTNETPLLDTDLQVLVHTRRYQFDSYGVQGDINYALVNQTAALATYIGRGGLPPVIGEAGLAGNNTSWHLWCSHPGPDPSHEPCSAPIRCNWHMSISFDVH